MDCDLNEIYRLVNDAMNRDEIKAFAAEFRQFPLRLSYSSYADGIRWLAGQYRSFGLETEVVSFPADGKTVYADRHFPLAWDISDAWAEVGGKGLPITGNALIAPCRFPRTAVAYAQEALCPWSDCRNRDRWNRSSL